MYSRISPILLVTIIVLGIIAFISDRTRVISSTSDAAVASKAEAKLTELDNKYKQLIAVSEDVAYLKDGLIVLKLTAHTST